MEHVMLAITKNTMQRYLSYLLILVLSVAVVSCKQDKATPAPKTNTTVSKPKIKIPKFDKNKAYEYVEKQLAFGHRIPGTPEHVATKDWYVSQLKEAGAKVEVQEFKSSFLRKKDMPSYNVIASFNSDHAKRVMLAAHWDSRLIAEKDPDEAKRDQPIMGADDGATGVAVLLEIANIIKANPIDLGIDIVLFDAEDQGETNGDNMTWCLGSQYWGKNPHIPNYKAKFGILLDMVGAENARFGHEGFSKSSAGQVMNKIWKLAQGMGYTDYFQDYDSGQVMDDHYHVMVQRQFPMVDIINMPDGFGKYHHTHDDNIDIISKRSLKVVGQVVTAVIYKESEGSF